MFKNLFKTLFVIFVSIVLTTITIDATDNLGNFSDSMIGGVLSGVIGKDSNACSEGMVRVNDGTHSFCIDIYEDSAGENCVYNSPSYQGETQMNIEQQECLAVSEKGKTPWRNVSQNQAILLCAKAGKRLPTSSEWYSAALGTPDLNNKCNIGKKELGLTGDFPMCLSYVGAYDMVGNVWEWVHETVTDNIYKGRELPEEGYIHSVDLEGIAIETGNNPNSNYGEDYFWIKEEGVMGVFRGGYWGLDKKAGLYSLYSSMSPDFVGVGVGFRCVK